MKSWSVLDTFGHAVVDCLSLPTMDPISSLPVTPVTDVETGKEPSSSEGLASSSESRYASATAVYTNRTMHEV